MAKKRKQTPAQKEASRAKRAKFEQRKAFITKGSAQMNKDRKRYGSSLSVWDLYSGKDHIDLYDEVVELSKQN